MKFLPIVIALSTLLVASCVSKQARYDSGISLAADQKIWILEEVCKDMIVSEHMKLESPVVIDWGAELPSVEEKAKLEAFRKWTVLATEEFERVEKGVRVSSNWQPKGGVIRLDVAGLSGQFAPDVYDFLMSADQWWLRKDIVLKDSNCPDFH